MINKAIIVGNLGADPETRTTNSGSMVCNLRLATTTRVKDGDSWTDRTEWHRVVCFGKTAENCDRFLKKGRQVYIEGRIQTREWTDSEGAKRWTTEIVAHEVKFLGNKGDDRPQERARPAPQPQGRGGYGGGYGGGGYGYGNDGPT